MDVEIINIANARISIEISEQIGRLEEDIARCKGEMAGRGVLQSSMTAKKISDLCSNAIINITQVIWQTLFRFVTTSGVKYTDELAAELKLIVQSHITENLDNIRNFIQRNAQIAHFENLVPKLEGIIDAACTRAISKVGTEIDLFVLSLKNREKLAEIEPQSTTFNIYSPVGSIQTGEHAIAYVKQKINSETKEQLNKSLLLIEESLHQLDHLPNYPKDEIIELIKEGQSEIQKQRPNVTKLRTMLSTVGASIQFVGSLKPAYESLKTALTHLGISLP